MSEQPSRPARHTGGPVPLGNCAAYASLARKAAQLDAQDRALRQALPSGLREQVRFAATRRDALVFVASSPAWASRLRLQQRHLLTAAKALGLHTSAVVVKVAPLPISRPVPTPGRPLSATAAQHLRAAADTTHDAELRAMLLALAEHATGTVHGRRARTIPGTHEVTE